jgi:uncharacterized protein (DUF4415 family)
MRVTRKTRPKNVSREDWEAVSSPPLSRAELGRLRPAAEALPDLVENYRRSRCRPRSPQAKKLVSLRLDAEVIEAFRAEGPGWQTRINDVLSRWASRRKKAA